MGKQVFIRLETRTYYGDIDLEPYYRVTVKLGNRLVYNRQFESIVMAENCYDLLFDLYDACGIVARAA